MARFHASGGARMMQANEAQPTRRALQRGKMGGRVRLISFRADAAEILLIDEKARTAGLSRGGFLRACALGTPGPRARRAPSVDVEALAHLTAALNKAGSLLNQIARVLNAGGSTVVARDYLRALHEVRAILGQIMEILGRKDHR